VSEMNHITWSRGEKGIARRAFDEAYEGECAELLTKVREMADAARGPRDLWRIHDFLDEKRIETDRKYAWRGSALIVVLGRLVHEGRIAIQDLEGLRQDKLAKIEAIVELGRRASDSRERQEKASPGDEDA
jgi:hypothetical protein